MSQSLKKYAPCFKKLLNQSGKKRKKLVTAMSKDKEFIKCMCECAKNVLKGNVELSKRQREKIRSRKQSFRKLVLKKTPISVKRRIVQNGGFLGALLGPIVSALGGLFGISST